MTTFPPISTADRDKATAPINEQFIPCRHPHVPPAPAVGEFDLPNGCICFDERRQFLCEQHADKLRRNDFPVRLLRAVNGFAIAAQQDRQTEG